VKQLAPADTRVVQDGDVALGQGISQFGSAMTDFFIKEQIEEDNAKVNEATTKLKQKMLDLTKGREEVEGPDSLSGPSRSMQGGYLNVKAGDIDDQFFNTQMEQFEQARNEIASELTNSDQEQMFKARADLAQINHGEGLVNHITEQKAIERELIDKASFATDLETMGLNYDNPSMYGQTLASIR
jgi:hypothetical protein